MTCHLHLPLASFISLPFYFGRAEWLPGCRVVLHDTRLDKMAAASSLPFFPPTPQCIQTPDETRRGPFFGGFVNRINKGGSVAPNSAAVTIMAERGGRCEG
jgi:hypothetical protein